MLLHGYIILKHQKDACFLWNLPSNTYSMEESQIQVYFSGGCLNGTEYSTPSLVKAYARKAQFGQIFTFDKKTSRLTDGVFRTSARGWYSFSHIALAFSFFFGHLWHASRAIFQDIWTGVTFESQAKQEYGRNEKLGDKTSSTKTTLWSTLLTKNATIWRKNCARREPVKESHHFGLRCNFGQNPTAHFRLKRIVFGQNCSSHACARIKRLVITPPSGCDTTPSGW